jgi:hexulose-6-phosphate isomerase
MAIRPSIRLSSLPSMIPYKARFAMARAAGYEGIEVDVGDGPAAELRAAATLAGVVIHSVHDWENYRKPLTSADPEARAAAIASTLAAIEAAHAMGAETFLLIPGLVDDEATYADVYARSQDTIRRHLLPAAERLGIVIGIENVWNGFLLSPFDCARYVSEFDSPYVRLYLDVGNIIFGRPEGWIDIAAPYVTNLHLKDLLHHHGDYRIARIGEGHIDWPRLRAALARAGFSGWAVMAEAEMVQPRIARFVFRLNRYMAMRLGPNPLFRLIDTFLSRRLIADAMRRFRRYVVPGAGPSAAGSSGG